MKRWDVVLIGSGISSLTAALLLSKAGKSVCVLESYQKPGGYMHCFQRFGERFDTGAHYVGAMNKGEPFHALLAYLGVYDDDLFTPLNPDGFDVFHLPKLTLAMPGNYEAVVERFSSHFPVERSAIQTYFNLIRASVQNFQTYEYSETVDTQQLVRDLETSLWDVVSSLTKTPALQTLMCAYVTLYGVAPHEAPFGLHAVVTDSLLRGVFGLRHGGDALAARFVQAIEQNGGEVRLRAPVTQIVTNNNLASAVITANGERFDAEWVISGIHPKLTLALIDRPEVFRPAFRERVANLKETPGLFGIYGICNGKSSFDRDRNYFYFQSDDPMAILNNGKPDASPHFIFAAPASRTPSLVGEGMPVNIHATAPFEWFLSWQESRSSRRAETYEALKLQYAEQVITAVEKMQPGFRGTLEKFVTSTPLSNIHFTGSPEGSPYGIYHSIHVSGARAIGPATHLANLFLTGQSTLFPGLLGAAISGLRTSGYITGIKPILKELREARQCT